MTHTIELNIRFDSKRGVNIPDTLGHRRQLALGLLGQYGEVSHRQRGFWPGFAHILILSVKAIDIPEATLLELAEVMLQDCVSVYYPVSGEGLMIGPRASEWGPFDLEKFYRFDPSLNTVIRESQSVVRKPPEPVDEETRKRQEIAMHLRIYQVFPPDVWNALAPQQQTLTDNAMNSVINRQGMEALTVDRLEGIYELVTEHLWSSALTAAANILAARTAVADTVVIPPVEDTKVQPVQASTRFDESTVVYLEAVVPDELTLAAAGVASDLGYDREGKETYITGNVLQLRWVTDESMKRFLGTDHDSDYPATMLRLDYEAWALPGDFDVEAPDRVICRREHIYVRASVVRDGEVYGYGLGPEYGFDHWEQDDCSEGTADEEGLPKDVISQMVQEIESNFHYQIEDYLVESSISRSWPKPIRQMYRKVRAAKKAKEAAHIRRQQVIRNELSGQPIELEPWVRLNDVTNRIRRHYIDSKTGHFRFILRFPDDFVEGQPVTVTVTKAERVFSLLGYRTLAVKELVCPIALCKSDIKAQFEKLALSGWPATEFVGAA